MGDITRETGETGHGPLQAVLHVTVAVFRVIFRGRVGVALLLLLQPAPLPLLLHLLLPLPLDPPLDLHLLHPHSRVLRRHLGSAGVGQTGVRAVERVGADVREC